MKNITLNISNYNLTSFFENLTNQTDSSIYTFSPNLFEWCLLLFAITIFIVGIIGNLLVVIVVVKNAHMRTITNIFIVNLAIGDFFVILICLPPSIITDISGNWWFGKTMCKIIPFVQYISVCISVMTLTSISYERYYAICYPLKFQATKFRAKIIILIIWILAIIINLPHPIVIDMNNESNQAYCYPTWNTIYQNIFDLLIFMILYILPMALIFYTYIRVVKVLWQIDKSIAWDEHHENTNTTHDDKKLTVPGACRSKKYTSPKTSQTNNTDVSYTMASGSSSAKSKMKNQLIARRKAAKMLISVAVMFAICYLPIHLLNILRFLGSNLLENLLGDYAIIIFQIAHCLVYVNSCINPLIYNFMSDNFRKEFRKVLFCDYKSYGHSENGEIKLKYSNVNSNHNMTNNPNNKNLNNRLSSHYTFVSTTTNNNNNNTSNYNQSSFKSKILNSKSQNNSFAQISNNNKNNDLEIRENLIKKNNETY